MRAPVQQHGANARDFVRPREGERLQTPTGWAVNPKCDQSLCFDSLVWPRAGLGRRGGRPRHRDVRCARHVHGKFRRAARAKVTLGALEFAGNAHGLRMGWIKRQQ